MIPTNDGADACSSDDADDDDAGSNNERNKKQPGKLRNNKPK